MTQAGDTVALKIRLRYRDLSEFVSRYAENISSVGLFIRTPNPKPPGTRIRFELALSDGQRALRGEGIVVPKKNTDPQGISIRFSVLEPESRALVDRVVRLAGQGQLAPQPHTTELNRQTSVHAFRPNWGGNRKEPIYRLPAGGWVPLGGARQDFTQTPPASKSSSPQSSQFRPWALGSLGSPTSPPNAPLVRSEPKVSQVDQTSSPQVSSPAAELSSPIAKPAHTTADINHPQLREETAVRSYSLTNAVPPRPNTSVNSYLLKSPADTDASNSNKKGAPVSDLTSPDINSPTLSHYSISIPESAADPDSEPNSQLEAYKPPEETPSEPSDPQAPTQTEPSEAAKDLLSHVSVAQNTRHKAHLEDELSRGPAPTDDEAPEDDELTVALLPHETVGADGALISGHATEPQTTEAQEIVPAKASVTAESSKVSESLPPPLQDSENEDSSPLAHPSTLLSLDIELSELEQVLDISAENSANLLAIEELLSQIASSSSPEQYSEDFLTSASSHSSSTENIEPNTASLSHELDALEKAASPQAQQTSQLTNIADNFQEALGWLVPKPHPSQLDEDSEEMELPPPDKEKAPTQEALGWIVPKPHPSQLDEDSEEMELSPPDKEKTPPQALSSIQDLFADDNPNELTVTLPPLDTITPNDDLAATIPLLDTSMLKSAEPDVLRVQAQNPKPTHDSDGVHSYTIPEDIAQGLNIDDSSPIEDDTLYEVPQIDDFEDIPPENLLGSIELDDQTLPQDIPIEEKETRDVSVQSLNEPSGASYPEWLDDVDQEPLEAFVSQFEKPSHPDAAEFESWNQISKPLSISEQEAWEQHPHPSGPPDTNQLSMPLPFRQRAESVVASRSSSVTPRQRGPQSLERRVEVRGVSSPSGDPTTTDLSTKTSRASSALTRLAHERIRIGLHISDDDIFIGYINRGELQVIAIDNPRLSPAWVALNNNEQLVFGNEAVRIASEAPSRAAPLQSVFQAISWKDNSQPPPDLAVEEDDERNLLISMAHRWILASDIFSVFFKNIYSIIVQHLGHDNIDLIISTPAQTNERSTLILRNAASQAQFNSVRFDTVPLALLRAFGVNRNAPDIAICIEIGLSHTTVTLIRRYPLELQVMDVRYTTQCSSALVRTHMVDAIVSMLPPNLNSGNNHELAELRDQILQQVSNMNGMDRWASELALKLNEQNGHLHQVQLPQIQMNAFFEEDVYAVTETIDFLLDKHSLNYDDVGAISIGGTDGYFPPLRNALTHRFAQEPVMPVHPAQAVLLGMTQNQPAASLGMLKSQRPTLISAIGLELPGGRYRPILFAGASLPTHLIRQFPTARDKQTEVDFRFYQGEAELVRQCQPLGALQLRKLPKRPKGALSVELNLSVDEYGMLRATLAEHTSGKSARLEVPTQQTPPELYQNLTQAHISPQHSARSGWQPVRNALRWLGLSRN